MAGGDWVVAVDPGSHCVRAVAVRRGRRGRIEVAGYGSTPSRGILRGTVEDPLAASDAIRRALQMVAQQSGLELRSIRCAVTHGSGPARFPAGEAHVSTPRAPVPRSGGSTIDAGAAARWLAERRALGGTVRPDPSLHRAAAGAGVLVESWHPASVAAGQSVLTPQEGSRRILLVDIGAGASVWGIWNTSAMEATGAIPIGGERFTSDLSIVLECDRDVAESLKCTEGSVRPVGESARSLTYRRSDGSDGRISTGEIAEILEARAIEWLDWIGRSIGDWAGVDTVVLTGGGSRLRGLPEVLLDRVGLAVRRGIPYAEVWRGTALDEPEGGVLAGIIQVAIAGNTTRTPSPGWETSVRWMLDSWRDWWGR